MFQNILVKLIFLIIFFQSIFYKLIYRVYKVFKATRFNAFTMA